MHRLRSKGCKRLVMGFRSKTCEVLLQSELLQVGVQGAVTVVANIKLEGQQRRHLRHHQWPRAER